MIYYIIGQGQIKIIFESHLFAYDVNLFFLLHV